MRFIHGPGRASAMMIAATLLLAGLSWRFVERPVLSLKRVRRPPPDEDAFETVPLERDPLRKSS